MEDQIKIIKRRRSLPEIKSDKDSRKEALIQKVEQSYRQTHRKRDYQPPATLTGPTIVFDKFKNGIERTIQYSIEKAIKEVYEEDQPTDPDEEQFDVYDQEEEDNKERIAYKTRNHVLNKILDELYFLVQHVRMIKKKTWEPPRWMVNGKLLWLNLQRTRVIDVYAWLRNNTLPRRDKETWEIIDKAGGHCWHGDYPDKKKAREHIICMPDLGKMSSELGMGDKILSRYLKKMSETGVIESLPHRIGRGGKKVYALGERRGFVDRKRNKAGMTPQWYLKDSKEIKKGLRELKIRGNAEDRI